MSKQCGQIRWSQESRTWVPEGERLFAKVDWDEEHGIVVNIDGQKLSIEEFQRTLGVFEGWYFSLQFHDPETVEGPAVPGVM